MKRENTSVPRPAKSPEKGASLQRSAGTSVRDSRPARSVVDLQHIVPLLGNLAAQRLFGIGTGQAASAPNRAEPGYEQEADRIANEVIAAPRAPETAKSSHKLSHTANGGSSTVSNDARQFLGPGQHLDPAARSLMEARFGRDMSSVRIHDNSKAANSAKALGAKAYTLGHDVVFSQGRYAPATEQGRRLLAHELTHVIQQTDTPSRGTSEESHGPVVRTAGRPCGPQLVPEMCPAPDWGSSGNSWLLFVPTATLSGRSLEIPPKGAPAIEMVPCGSEGTLQIVVLLVFYYAESSLPDPEVILHPFTPVPLPIQRSGVVSSVATVNFRVSPEGSLKFLGKPGMDNNTRGSEEGFLNITRETWIGTDGGDGWIGLKVDAESSISSAKQSSKTDGSELGAEVGVEPGGVGVKGSHKSTSSSGSSVTTTRTGKNNWTRSCAVVLHAAPPTPTFNLPAQIETLRVLFAGDDAVVNDVATAAILNWFNAIPEEDQKKIMNGEFRLDIVGHASTTAGSMYDLELSLRRAKAVEEALRIRATRSAHIRTVGVGKSQATTADNVESQKERYVDISISHDDNKSGTKPAGGSTDAAR